MQVLEHRTCIDVVDSQVPMTRKLLQDLMLEEVYKARPQERAEREAAAAAAAVGKAQSQERAEREAAAVESAVGPAEEQY